MKRFHGLVVLAFSVILTGCFWASPSGTGLEDGRLKPCPDSPNCVSSRDTDSHSIEPLKFEGSGAVARNRLQRILEDEYDASLVTRSDTYVHATVTTTLGFVDDLEFLIVPREGTIHLRSASRVGYSDLGTNRDRIEKIRSLFNQQ